jgi:hypothetical protein
LLSQSLAGFFADVATIPCAKMTRAVAPCFAGRGSRAHRFQPRLLNHVGWHAEPINHILVGDARLLRTRAGWSKARLHAFVGPGRLAVEDTIMMGAALGNMADSAKAYLATRNVPATK